MVTLLLRCTSGFLDSVEGVPIDKDRLNEVGRIKSKNPEEIERRVRDIGGSDAYYIPKSSRSKQIIVYQYRP